jgi:dTDP-4-dehydrorhamnose reductase
MLRVLITGASGMLGRALLACAPPEVQPAGVGSAEGDLTEPQAAVALLTRYQPHAVIHCAAWTDVEGCTRDPARAMLVNGAATANVAQACGRHHARLIYLSTDYVFVGDLGRAYVETDNPRPLNAYGESKLAGERVAAELADHLIVRTQWLYGPGGKNFVATIVKAARQRPALRVVADEWGSPTYVLDLAQALWRVAAMDLTGVLHLTNSGVCTWHELASAALAAAGLPTVVEPISAAEWASPTVRPKYSPLANARWLALGQRPLRPWQQAVTEYVQGCLSE